MNDGEEGDDDERGIDDKLDKKGDDDENTCEWALGLV
jgi:hypothetical protein